MKTIVSLIEPYIELRREKQSKESYCGPCPFCGGGDDRFVVWPDGNQSTYPGNYECRQCKTKGDAYHFCTEILGLSGRDALRYLGRRDRASFFKIEKPLSHLDKLTPEKKTPESHRLDSKKWVDVAHRCVEYYHSKLLESEETLFWLSKKRGIKLETAIKFKLGLNSEEIYLKSDYWGLKGDKKVYIPEGLIIPHINPSGDLTGIKIRTWKPTDLIKPLNAPYAPYIAIRGTETPYLFLEQPQPHKTVIIVESELDGILLSQEVGDIYTPLALLTSGARPDINFDSPPLYALDGDEAGQKNYIWWAKTHDALHIEMNGDITDEWARGISLYDLKLRAKPKKFFNLDK